MEQSERDAQSVATFVQTAPRHLRLPPPIMELLGITLTSVGDGQAVMEMDATERHTNPMGTLHGGVLCDIADAAMGIAYQTFRLRAPAFRHGGESRAAAWRRRLTLERLFAILSV